MSADRNQIICRKCRESVSLDNSNCPNCGASLRGVIPYVGGILFGIILMGATVLNIDQLLVYGVIGLIVAATSAYFLYERRQRIAEADAQSGTFEG